MGSATSKSSTNEKGLKSNCVAGHMECIVLESNIKIGAFYDICEHKFFAPQQSFGDLPKETTPLTICCDVVKGNDMNIGTFLMMLKMDRQLALNMFTHSMDSSDDNMCQGFFKFAQRSSNCTRFIFYQQKWPEAMLPEAKQHKNIPINQSVTHMVTEITFGLILLIWLQVPDKLKLRDVDKQLHILCSHLRRDQNNGDANVQFNALDELKIKAKWSNQKGSVPFDKASEIREYIDKWNKDQAKPLSFCLQPIAERNDEPTHYTDISAGIIHDIFCTLLTLNHHLNQALERESASKTNDQSRQLKKSGQKFLKSLKTTLVEIRRKQKSQHTLVEMMYQDEYQLLFDKLGYFHKDIACSTDDSSSQSNDESTPTILLLGETGVGKSTFINGLVNYLKFDTFEEAQVHAPLAVVSAKIFITRDTDFKDEVIEIGPRDSNEAYDKRGQSVTQQCKTHHILTKHNIQFNMIDTPGIGDTRGRKFDDENIQNISSTIQAAKNLTAVCILLKPNVSRNDISFRSNLKQLFDVLGSSMRKNIFFCFTNTRLTSYLPGDTLPLLISVLEELRDESITFKKSRTFCFDSESFRYLVAIKNGILFKDHQKLEYKESWSRSVAESKRWLATILSLNEASILLQKPLPRLENESHKNTSNTKESGQRAHTPSKASKDPANIPADF